MADQLVSPVFPLGISQDFNTLPSRQLLHAHEQAAPPAAAPSPAPTPAPAGAGAGAEASFASSPRGGDNDGIALSQSRTPHSREPDTSWRSQASSGVDVGAGASTTSRPLEGRSGIFPEGYAEAEAKGEDGGGWRSSGAPSWRDDGSQRGNPVSLRCALFR